ncbi:quaternary amine ABC transporter ATP-binding protein [Mesorhizobium sp. NZP2298]|uniref:quaternary amine ABC transporter ATP-binding protein n=1 Tax=Mesorhizobium sp. NZP2298 TaxID=2483403 RepID=UPI0015524BC3|nr:betaine/proline/choline family ABC transporter ATP-binding protein [Mesorhizobium sp. NZP2298]QKC98858.1 ATP-binding cassette domain-containing protein [Mesorhizobium sp. NZP2298]
MHEHRKPAIEIKDLYKIYGDNPELKLDGLRSGAIGPDGGGGFVALNHINMTVEAGKIFVIMGLSGSGKSTMLRCINRLIDPTAGRILVNGQDITKANKKELRHIRSTMIGMVFQHFALLPHMSVIDNVAFGLRIAGIGRKERWERAGKALELVGLSGWDKRKPSNLSGGMRQRVGLARALVMDTPVLLMDEPFSALDPLIREEMQQELLRLQNTLNKTIVFVTHDPNEAATIGDRIAILLKGQVVQEGRPMDVVLSPANDYVRDFVRGIDVFKVLSAGQVMDAVRPPVELMNSEWTKHLSHDLIKLSPNDLIAPYLDELSKEQRTLVVVKDDGTPVGTVTSKSVLKALAAHSSIGGTTSKAEKLNPAADAVRETPTAERAVQ